MRTMGLSLLTGRLLLAAGVVILACGTASADATGGTVQQLVPNGDMERDGGWQSMSDGKGTTPTVNEQSFADKHSGKASRRIIISRQGMRDWPSVYSASFATESGKTYEVRFWCKAIRGAFGVVVCNGAGNDNITPTPRAMCVPHYDMMNKFPIWTEYVGRYTEENGGKNAYVRFVIASAGEVAFYLDDVSVKEIHVTPEAVQGDWRKLFPAKPYVCWAKSPWEPLEALQSPPARVKACKELAVAMGQNEYESCSFVVTNLSDGDLKAAVSLKEPAIPVVLRQAVWVTDYDGAKINDALPLLEGSIVIPPAESREVWLTLHTGGQKPGDYVIPIEVDSQGGSVTIPLKVKVYPVALPEDKPLYTHYWDDLVPAWTGPEKARALVEDMKAHYVNVAFGHPWPVRMQLDAAGKLKHDYTDLDQVLEAYRLLDPKMIVFFWNAEAYLEKQEGFWSDAWKARFKEWLTDLVEHLKEKGWGYDRFAMNPYDESIRPAVCNMVKLVKEIDPRILIYVNSTGQTEDEVKAIAPYVDIWDPYLYDYLNRPPYDRLYDVKKTAAEVLRKRVKADFFWTYANPPGSRPKAAPPYRDYRLALWQAWEQGMRGFGYWVYSYKTHWNSYKQKDGPNWAVVYFADAEDAPPGISKKELVVPSKRWEATREGVEDYVYLYMLQEAVAEAGRRGADHQATEHAKSVLAETPKKVLAGDNSPSLADEAKEEIIKAIVRLSAEKREQ